MKFKIGDKVKVRPDLSWDMDGWPSLVTEMFPYAESGQVFTISEIRDYGCSKISIRLLEDDSKWSFSMKWLIPGDPNWRPLTKEEEVCLKVRQLWERSEYVKSLV